MSAVGGVYSRNKLFDSYFRAGVENLSVLEDDVSSDGIVEASVFENYETAIEDGWPDFIKDAYGDDL